MTENDQIGAEPSTWRNFSIHFPIPACRLSRPELKRLYQIIDTKQKEYRDRALTALFLVQGETEEHFEARRAEAFNAFVTSVTITGVNNEIITANNEQVFEDADMPTAIQSIFYTTMSVPQAVLKHLPGDRITVLLDFSSSPFFDFDKLPTLPTPNISNFEIYAKNEQWFAAAKLRLSEFFSDRQTKHNWLHRSAVYDILLALVGLPMAVLASLRVATNFKEIDNLSLIPRSLIYVYVFYVTLIIFRLIFSYARWVLPKVEMSSEVQSSQVAHRFILGAIILAVIGEFVFEIIKIAV
ncbi:MAG: hypothetical protein ACLP1W_08665 [Rhodomicrobium sp.]